MRYKYSLPVFICMTFRLWPSVLIKHLHQSALKNSALHGPDYWVLSWEDDRLSPPSAHTTIGSIADRYIYYVSSKRALLQTRTCLTEALLLSAAAITAEQRSSFYTLSELSTDRMRVLKTHLLYNFLLMASSERTAMGLWVRWPELFCCRSALFPAEDQ
jgi:hypothetical protein